jgi:CHAD domain-containing protein
MSFRIRRSESVADAIRRIAREQVDAALTEAGERGHGGADAVHRVRKRCKRVRALLRLVRPQLKDRYASENAWYRDAARDLAHVRDAEIVPESFDNLLKHFADPIDRRAIAPIRAHLSARRTRMRDRADLRNRLRIFSNRMRKARGRIETWDLVDSGFAALEGGLTKSYSQGRKAMHAAYDAPSTAALHEWRKRVKDHALHIHVLRCVWKEPMSARRDEIEALADRLGDDHDLSVLRETLLADSGEETSGETLQAVLGLIERRQVELRIAAQIGGARIFAEKPHAFVTRIEGYWHAWRNDPTTATHAAYRPELVTD